MKRRVCSAACQEAAEKQCLSPSSIQDLAVWLASSDNFLCADYETTMSGAQAVTQLTRGSDLPAAPRPERAPPLGRKPVFLYLCGARHRSARGRGK